MFTIDNLVKRLMGRSGDPKEAQGASPSSGSEPFQGHLAFGADERGVSYELLFGEHMNGARNIEIIDPYIQQFYQCRNLMELLEVALRHMDYEAPSRHVHLVTAAPSFGTYKQEGYLNEIVNSMLETQVYFTYEINFTGTIHARHIKIDNTWDILLDRGLDIFQPFNGSAFDIQCRIPELRRVRPFEVTYLRLT